MINFAEENGVEVFVVDLKKYCSDKLKQQCGKNYFLIDSADEESVKKLSSVLAERNINLDFIVFNNYLERLRNTGRKAEIEFSASEWDKLLEEWLLNTYLIFKYLYPFLNKESKSRVIYLNSGRGYTGQNSIESGGNIIEAGLSGALLGVMTSTAREIIPEGVSVNGIALDNNFKEKWPKIRWVMRLWMSGIAEYSCAETIMIS